MAAPHNKGLAKRMRDWMKNQQRPFTKQALYVGIGAVPGSEREAVSSALGDFVDRCEVERTETGSYRYSHEWKRKDEAPLRQRMLKAMYVSGQFTARDLQRLTGYSDRGYIPRIIRALRKDGLIQLHSKKICEHNAGSERVWYIPNRDRFRLEVME